ncbi:GxxExxY protein [candidate division WOR-3 bacterium]|nr:GxxExxY protein [candidate division WOR-3 bacterium]
MEPRIRQIGQILEKPSKLLYKELSYKIIGATMEVHKILGQGFLEAVYEEALAYEFELRDIPFERQERLDVKYKDIVAKEYTADFVVDGKIIVEIKAIRCLSESEEAQLQNYLKATGIRVGLLFNFGECSLNYKKLIR